jgi:hypothetical protein
MIIFMCRVIDVSKHTKKLKRLMNSNGWDNHSLLIILEIGYQNIVKREILESNYVKLT